MFSAPNKIVLILAWALALLAGCTTIEGRKPKSSGVSSSGPIDALVLLTAPAAVDIEPPSGPDGVAVRIYATASARAKALAITTGSLQVFMFDGVISEQSPSDVQPLKIWNRSAKELTPFANKTAIGVSYSMTLRWGEAVPKQDNITIVARYLDPSGRSLYSSLSTIPVGARPK